MGWELDRGVIPEHPLSNLHRRIMPRPSFCAIPHDPTAYYAQPSEWSLSLARRWVDLILAAVALLLVAAHALAYYPLSPIQVTGTGDLPPEAGRAVRSALYRVQVQNYDDSGARDEGPSLTKRGDPR